MSAVFRHITVRLWVTALAGGLICTVLLPQWHRMSGLQSLWIPVTLVMAGCFMLVGHLMNRLGMFSIRRQIAEAAVWERAGSNAEAEAAFERAKALYDACWLSPFQRRRTADWIIMRLARFCLAQPYFSKSAGAAVTSYLQIHPEDQAIALGWLEKMLQKETHSHEEYETATRINEALPDHTQVQRLLMQFYLGNERSDFEAMQTYRRVWQSGSELSALDVGNLARLLINETCISEWALKVYLKGYALGDDRCLEGIAASIRQLRSTPGNRDDLAAAGIIFAGLNEQQRADLIRMTASLESGDEAELENDLDCESEGPGRQVRFTPMWRALRSGWESFCALARTATIRLLHRSTQWRSGWKRDRLRRLAPWGMLAAAVSVLLVVTIWRTTGLEEEIINPAPEPQTQAPVAETSYLFTIQVAAYLKTEDAQLYVERLKNQKIEAFWTKATGSNRTWYQVKVSHFTTRDEARAYGEALKAKGVIDDFYVANHIP
jgi:hypothetical protein